MNALECAGNNACRQYCEALRAQGVTVEIGEAGCNVPAMFTADGVDFDPKLAEDALQDNVLVSNLGGVLRSVLIERTQNDTEREAVTELIKGFDTVLSARFNLWQAMLDATRAGRKFTDVELNFYEDKQAEAEAAIQEQISSALPGVEWRAQTAVDHKTLSEHGLLFDDQMTQVVDRLVGNLMDSKPALLVGDQGIAKTQVAKFVAKLWEPHKAPTVISGHGDMMSNELIGQMKQDKDTKVFVFQEGKLVQAMKEGRPVIIDDGNFSDQAVMARILDLLLMRPGQPIMLQEDGDKHIVIKPGFVVYMTANEASSRHLYRHKFTPAYRDRFDVWQLRYPDNDNPDPLTKIPRSLMRLAFAAAVDEQGIRSRHIEAADVERFVRLAHNTQHLYSVPAQNARITGLKPSKSTSNYLDDEPAMTDCITPRTLADTIARCALGNKPGMTLENEMERLIVGLDQAGGSHNQDYAREVLELLSK